MAYKDILIYLDPSPGAEDRLRFAAGLAQTHMARLIGVDASSNDAFLGASAERAIQISDRFAEAVTSSSMSTTTPQRTADPAATSNRAGSWVRNLRMIASRSIPITESCGPTIPTSVMYATAGSDSTARIPPTQITICARRTSHDRGQSKT